MAAKTANNILQMKDVSALTLFPVDSGQTIYQNTLVGVDTDGLLKNIAAANVATLRIVGIVADDSANLTPAATTADGSILADRSSADAGDKTVRQVWMQGRFLLNFAETVAQDDLGKLAYAKNNNDCYLAAAADAILIGTIVGIYSSSQAWVELNKFYPEYPDTDLVVLSGSLTAATDTTAGGVLSVDNPFAANAIVEQLAIVIGTASTGAATADFGIGTTSSSDTLLDGVTLNGAVTGLKTIGTNGGTNGKAFRPMGASDKILGTASADATGLVGTYKAVIRKY
jgi:hypothetical protein